MRVCLSSVAVVGSIVRGGSLQTAERERKRTGGEMCAQMDQSRAAAEIVPSVFFFFFEMNNLIA